MLAKIFQHFTKFPKMVIFITLMMTLFFTYEAGQKLFDDKQSLIIDNSIEPFMAQDSQSYTFYKKVQSYFSKGSQLIVAANPSNGNFDLDFFNNLQSLSDELTALAFVEKVDSVLSSPNPKGACSGKSYFHKEGAGSVCQSIISNTNKKLACIKSQDFKTSTSDTFNSDLDEGLEGGLDDDLDSGLDEGIADSSDDLDADLDSSLEEDLEENSDTSSATTASSFVCTQSIATLDEKALIIETNRDIAKVIKALSKDPFIQKDLISKDFKKIASILHFTAEANANSAEVQEAVSAIFDKYHTRGISIHFAGEPREQYESSKVLRNDIQTILPLSLFLMAIVLLLSFKSGRGVLIPFSVVSIGIVWTFGFFAFMGDELNLVSMILPPLLVSVGSAYIIHVLNHYYHEAKTEPNMRTVMNNTLNHTSIPMVVTAFTTIAGFAALVLSPIPAIKQMGIYASFGISMVVLLSLVFAPALLQLLPQPKTKVSNETEVKVGMIDSFLAFKAKLVGRFSLIFILTWVVVVVIALLGTLNISFSSGGSTFREELAVSKDLKFIESNFAGTSSVSVVLSGKNLQTAQTFLDINTLKQTILDPQSTIGKIKDLRVDKIYSPVEYLDFHRQGLDNLKDGEVVNFFKDLKKHNGPQFLTDDERYMRFSIRMTINNSKAFLELKRELDRELKKYFKGLDVQLTGGAILTSESNDNIAKGQVSSIIMALGIIFVVLSILFFSFKMGFLALYPNIAAIGLFFGILGWFDIPISVTISVIAAIALGIGVDDTIHFLSHYNMEIRKTRNEKEASLSTLRMIGRPMIFTTVTLTLGFVVFALSDMQSQILFGLFTAMTLFICLITDLNFLPSIMARTKVITLWDYLDLEYDEDFIKKISIFKGMSLKEAKLTTLMAYRSTFEKGEVLFTEGDVSREMFVVLEGSIEVFLDESKHTQERHLANLGQNSVFGEMGLLRDTTRSASARASEKTTLLVFNEKVLGNMKRRYPKISKKLFLNLARKLLLSVIKSNYLIEESFDFNDKTIGFKPHYRSIFEDMSENEKSWLLNHASTQEYEKGSKIFKMGDPGESLYIILEGSCSISIDEEHEHEVHILKEGDIAGYALVISDQTRRPTTLTALEDTKLAVVSQELYDEMFENHHRISSKFNYNMVCLLSDRLEHNNSTLHY